MNFKTNPYLKELEKKHPKWFFVLYIIASVVVLAIGLGLLLYYKEDKTVSVLLIVSGTAGLLSVLLLKILKNTK